MREAKLNRALGLWVVECKCGLWTVFAPTKDEAEAHFGDHMGHKCRLEKASID